MLNVSHLKRTTVAQYEVGFIYGRSFIQKQLDGFSNCSAHPLRPTGHAGEIHNVRHIFEDIRFPFTRADLERTLVNFSNTGHCTLLKFTGVEAKDFVAAIESKEREAENVIGAICVASANPGMPLCAYGNGGTGNGVKVYVPNDRLIRHGTNVPGILDALPEIERRAQTDSKFALLLRLYRASLREREVDNQILFQLLLLEEASDLETGSFAERLRAFAVNTGFFADLAIIAQECGVTLPAGKDVIDLLVKLRNASAHNGNISEASLKEFGGDWVVPTLADKDKLHKLITEALRYMFCCMVGHTRDQMAINISAPFEIRFD